MTLSACRLTGSQTDSGLEVKGKGSRAVASRCKMEDNQDCGANIYGRGVAELFSCTLSRNKTKHGLKVCVRAGQDHGMLV